MPPLMAIALFLAVIAGYDVTFAVVKKEEEKEEA